MKHLNRFNKNSEFTDRNITEEDKKFFDFVFSDFIDNGAKSELYETNLVNISNLKTEEIRVSRYRIFLSLASMASKNKNLYDGVNGLVKYSTELNDLVLEVQSCFYKIKSEEDFKNLNIYIYTDDDIKLNLSLNMSGGREEQLPDRFNIVLCLYK